MCIRDRLLAVRPDLKVKDLRGNVNTRLRKLADDEYDAIILAFIGVSRLDLIKDVPFSQKLPLTMMIPPMGQASLGIQIIAKNSELREMVKVLNDEDSFLCAKLERDFVAKIEVGCSAPVAVNAIINGDEVSITSMIGLPDGSEILKKR
jgi:Porphobilinogen deaminase